MGWDPTIVRLPPEDTDDDLECQYEITVYDSPTGEDIVYRTLELISSIAADGITGRGTRVWSAYRKGTSPTETKVIKDYWVDVDRTWEGHIYSAIRDDAKVLPEKDQARLHRHLPTIDSHGDVLLRHATDVTSALDNGLLEQAPGIAATIDLTATLGRSRGVGKKTPTTPLSERSYVDRFPLRPV